MDAVSLKLAKNYTNEKIIENRDNNLPTKTVTFDGGIYSVGSDVVEGQVSDVVVKGRSLKNELNYNSETWVEWTKTSGVVGDGTGLEITADGSTFVNSVLRTQLKSNTKYGILLNIVSSNLTRPLSVGASDRALPGVQISSSAGNKKAISTSQTTIVSNTVSVYVGPTELDGNKIKIRDIRIFELPAGSEIEKDFDTTVQGATNLTADQLAQKYPYINGDSVKSTNSVRVKSVGKNLLKKLESLSDFISPISNNINVFFETDKLVITTLSTFQVLYTNPIRVKPNMSYRFSIDGYGSAGYRRVEICDRLTGATVLGYASLFEERGIRYGSFNSGSNEQVYIRFYITSSVSPGNMHIYSIQLEEGSTYTEYEPYKESIVNVNLPKPLRSLPNGVKDEISVGSNGTVETRRNRKYVLQASDITSITSGVYTDIINISKPNDSIGEGNLLTSWLFFNGYTEFIIGTSDDTTKINMYRTFGNVDQIQLIVAKDTYANLAAAQLH